MATRSLLVALLLGVSQCACGEPAKRPPAPVTTLPPVVTVDDVPKPACPPPVEDADYHEEVLDQRKLRASEDQLRQLSSRLSLSLSSAARCLEPEQAQGLTLLHATILREQGEHADARDGQERAVLIVERSQRVGSWEIEAAVSEPPPAASELEMSIALSVDGTGVELVGCGRREEVPLVWTSPDEGPAG